LRRDHFDLIPTIHVGTLLWRQLAHFDLGSGRIHRSGPGTDFQRYWLFSAGSVVDCGPHAAHHATLHLHLLYLRLLLPTSRRRRVQRGELVHLLVLLFQGRLSFLYHGLLLGSRISRFHHALLILKVMLALFRGAISDIYAHHLDRGIQSKLLTDSVEVLRSGDQPEVLLLSRRPCLLTLIRGDDVFRIVLLVNFFHLLVIEGCVDCHGYRSILILSEPFTFLDQVSLKLPEILQLLLKLLLDRVLWVRSIHFLSLCRSSSMVLRSDCIPWLLQQLCFDWQRFLGKDGLLDLELML
jgi:hypothetical protein